jgi:hypothetical protein
MTKINWQAKLLEAIPLLIGVAITRRFNLHGWRAILVYALAAGTTRQVIAVLESEINPEQQLTRSTEPIADGNGHNQQPALDLQALTPPPSEATHQVVHASPGRLRVRVPQTNNPHYARHLQRHLDQDDRLEAARVNPHAASVTVQYDIKRFTEAEIQAFLSELIRLAFDVFTDKLLSEV